MLARLRENLVYKILALGFAIALHFYVVAQENPSQSHTINALPVTIRGLPPHLLLDKKTVPVVAVTLSGPADVVNRMQDTDVEATIDLSKAHAGKNTGIPVRVILPPGESHLSMDLQPPTVSVILAAKVKRQVAITASDPGTPPAGFIFNAARITPRYATIEGDQDSVSSVKQVVANVEAGKAVGTIDNDFALVALDQQGAQVNNITLTPTSAHVLIKMDRVPSSRTLFVDANIVGAPSYPYKVTGVDVSPQTLTVAGRPEVLSSISSITTGPINVSGATADRTQKVDCIAPSGLEVLGSKRVTVTVHVVSEPAPVSEPPAPTPPAANGDTTPH